MIYLRSWLFLMGLMAWTIVMFPAVFLTVLLPVKTRLRMIVKLWTNVMLKWLKCSCGVSHVVEGMENVPNTTDNRGYIVLSKHQSGWETLALQLIFPNLVWVLKRELLLIPFFGWGLFLSRPIAINRKKGKSAMKQLISSGRARLDDGLNVLLFPEGTRVKFGHQAPFKHGGSILACETESAIVPVALNAGKCWPKNSILKYPGTITVRIGEPITTKGKRYDQVTEEVGAWIVKNTQELERYAD